MTGGGAEEFCGHFIVRGRRLAVLGDASGDASDWRMVWGALFAGAGVIRSGALGADGRIHSYRKDTGKRTLYRVCDCACLEIPPDVARVVAIVEGAPRKARKLKKGGRDGR